MPEIHLTAAQQEMLMREALAEAERGMGEGEAPIGCVIARREDGQVRVVARGHNRVNALQRKIAHAEIVTFENAGGGGGRAPALPLDATDVILVSTLEPCVMCLGAAMEAGVGTVLFGMDAPADNGTHRVRPPESPESTAPDITGGILADESRRLFEQWLQGKKGTEQAKFVEQLLALTAGKRLRPAVPGGVMPRRRGYIGAHNGTENPHTRSPPARDHPSGT